MYQSNLTLPIIVIAQFCCTTLWFAGNSVIQDLIINFNLNTTVLGHLTSAVQFGFIIGTLVFSLFAIADRFSPSKVFFICAILGGIFNLGILWNSNTLFSLIVVRFFTGFFLAGIYPVGMKIASDYYDNGLGKSLSFLVGALVIGTAFPHLLKDVSQTIGWNGIIITTSAIACTGGLLMSVFVPNGPYRKTANKIELSACLSVFKDPKFKSVALGYFGHMWELYTFWTFVPLMLISYSKQHLNTDLNIPLLTFSIIGIGGVACVVGGYISEKIGSEKTAFSALFLSGLCCVISPFVFITNSPPLFISFLMFWGIVVIVDSPLFSSLIAKNVKPELKGTALTIVNCIGFSISIFSIQFINELANSTDSNYIYCLLAIGPILGLYALYNKPKKEII